MKRILVFYYRLFPWILRYPAKNLVERIKILFDYLYLRITRGLNMDEYYEFEFEKRSKEFRDSFLGWAEQGFYLRVLNPIKYYTLARNKYLAHRMLENVGVRKTPLYCYYQTEGKVFDCENIASDIKDVIRILKNKNVRQCVIKETETSHGEGVIVVKDIEYLGQDCKLYYFNGKDELLSNVLGRHPLLFEGLVQQTGQFSQMNESSVNTIRFMTTLYPDGEARIIATFIKIGRAGKCVDNAGDGGNVDVCVDTETGKIKYAIQYDGWRKIKDIECHPDSGNQLNGIVIENWEKIKAEVIKFQQAFPYCKAAGWDIAITDEGPVVIEVNDSWDRTGQYFIRRGWKNEIKDCYKAWRQVGYDPMVERGSNNFSKMQLRKYRRMFK